MVAVLAVAGAADLTTTRKLPRNGLLASCRMTSENLRSYRRAHRLSHLELADRLCVSPVTVSRWEAGKIPIPDWVDHLASLPDAPSARQRGASFE